MTGIEHLGKSRNPRDSEDGSPQARNAQARSEQDRPLDSPVLRSQSKDVGSRRVSVEVSTPRLGGDFRIDGKGRLREFPSGVLYLSEDAITLWRRQVAHLAAFDLVDPTFQSQAPGGCAGRDPGMRLQVRDLL